MIVQLRGTSGSGKSTIVRSIQDCLKPINTVCVPGRKRPLYQLWRIDKQTTLATLGHYETPCGGCDTISNYDDIYALVRKLHTKTQHVLFEGLLISGEVKRTVALAQEGLPVHVIGIDYAVEDCIEAVNSRRRMKNPEAKPVSPANTESKHKIVERVLPRLKAEGIHTYYLSRDDTTDKILELFEI